MNARLSKVSWGFFNTDVIGDDILFIADLLVFKSAGRADVDSFKSELLDDDFLFLQSHLQVFSFILKFVNSGPHFIFFNCTCPVCTSRMGLWTFRSSKGVGSAVVRPLRWALSVPGYPAHWVCRGLCACAQGSLSRRKGEGVATKRLHPSILFFFLLDIHYRGLGFPSFSLGP